MRDRLILRTLRFAAICLICLTLGFSAAIFFTWTYTFEYHSAICSYETMTDKNGDICRIPIYTKEKNISAHAEPYRPTKVVDLFDDKESK